MTVKYKRKSSSPAFTIVELLVVIVVIGILAAITIVSYTGITSRATASALQSDLTSASQQLKLYQIDHSAYPTSLNASNCPLDSLGVVDNTYCLKPTSGNTFLYSANNNSNPQTFSLYAINTSTSTKYRTTNDSTPTLATPVNATGGTITTVGGYKIHTFTTSGTFTVSSGDNVEVLVVGGGGSGGTSVGGSGGGGGGGSGGLIYNSYYPVTSQSYAVTIGNGGPSVSTSSTRGSNGGNSVFNSLNAIGGGGGGNGTSNDPGSSGGSGGGAGYGYYGFVSGSPGTFSQGNKGGNTLNSNNAGGGGGAGGVGGDTYDCRPLGTCTIGNGGLGGPGLAYSISGISVTYAKGGEGGAPPNGFANGAANTGNGGSGVYAAGGSSGAGGSGIVIIRYPN